MTQFDTWQDIAIEIVEERSEQHEEWGDQSHLKDNYSSAWTRTFATQAQRWKEINDARSLETYLSWDGVLLEEAFEAIAETDPVKRRAELIQVAAVALAMIEAIDAAAAEPEPDVFDDFDGVADAE